MGRSLHLILLYVLLMASAVAGADDSIRLQRIEVERLPDMNIPRSAHSVFCVNGEVTVVGGHTTNFIPTATAEYYRDGQWHLLETAYPHDNGVSLVLSSGKVIIGGGSEKPLGIGQTFGVEEYDPATHTFRGYSCFDTKRTMASAVEIDSGRVVVAGNWYAGDSIEVFDGDRYFHFVKEVTIGRASPYILRSASDDVLILGNGGTHGEVLRSDIVDRLKGTPLHVPLLKRWQPLFHASPMSGSTGFIGDESRGDYSWLLPVQDWTEGDTTSWESNRQLAFMLVSDTAFTLLPTTCAVPREGLNGGIIYYSPVLADRRARRAYVHGIDRDNRHYLVCVEYDKRPAPLTLYYTDPLPEAGWPQIYLTDDGNLIITGGINYNTKLGGTLGNDNYSPLSSVFLLRVGPQEQTASHAAQQPWLWIVLVAALLLSALYLIIYIRRQPARRIVEEESVETTVVDAKEPDSDDDDNVDSLKLRISQLMERERPYLDSSLKLADLAARLETNRNVVSACINSQWGCSFSQFMATYRVEYAKELIRKHPDMKMTQVWLQSGFTTESSFFRAFKAMTGSTPSEWKAEND